MWARLAYPSQLPLHAWLTDFAERVEHMRQWMCKGAPSAYWLPAFFFPQARHVTYLLKNHFPPVAAPLTRGARLCRAS